MVKKYTKTGRRKKGYTNKWGKKRIPRSIVLKNVHYFKRHYSIGDVFKGSGATPYLQGFDFALQDLPNYSEFTALYDSYKICAVKVWFVPGCTVGSIDMNTGAPVSAQVNFASARCFSAIDYNDSSAPSTINEIREYSNCKMSPMQKGHKRYFKPRQIDSSNAYNLPRNIWVDCSVPNRTYYGLKFGIDFNSYNFLTTTQIGKLEACIYFKCKSVR